VITHLTAAWQAEPVGAIDPEDFYDFQVTRPVTEVTDGATRRLVWPTTRLLTPAKSPGDRDVVLVHGIEPNMRWRRFCAELVAAFTELRTDMVVLLGALLADSPHTRPVPVTTSASDEVLASGLRASPADYKGPTGITGVLQHECAEAGIAAVSLWLADLAQESRAWERGVDELAEQDSEVADYVRTLEEAKDATDLPEATGDAIAAEFERYLRRRRER
jgi:hypothetical protein